MDAILQCDKTQALKHVTFTAGTMQAKPAMHDRVVHQRVENTALSPRVEDALPRDIMVAAVDKLYGPPHPMSTRFASCRTEIGIGNAHSAANSKQLRVRF